MNDFAALLSQGTSNALLFIPSAILLGALHGLEPGHSKTMMAAFIVAIRGSVRQAVMLGLAATLSHTAVVWLIAMGGMYISRQFTAEAAEPWLQLVSGFIIIATAAWMFWRTWSEAQAWHQHHDHQHGSQHHHEHGHHEHHHEHSHHHEQGHHEHEHHYEQEHHHEQNHYHEHGRHEHEHHHVHSHHHEHEHHPELAGFAEGSQEYQDAHERAHAEDIRRRFDGREVSNLQILLFGLTGGLIPCPAAITVLLLCLQVKQFSLGAVLVVCFSIGLALTLVTVGVGAALSVRHVTRRWKGFADIARRAPYFSSALIAIVGVYMMFHGYSGLSQ
ncbi:MULTISPECIES: nickel/cobalt efflux protein RcnA [unclassified Pantoea]|uniref:nickel/cobalt efflux protein RcnA n=1 Tax=unclassified Pantoea TaxID=2630326 RepID=UPI001CD6AE85|nr:MULTISPECIES: nickel/cobalt efflux protein RcnA [unclassified Pantoea]MCA1177752.1 nickel/cobalt efflux protein RcnA [Pantoea sp. alder69]MCA1252777.1 nickel/cobalt efflux protein RcnA [Pantoea sp. alder70]MCA1266484.1 nickel/cobalt efflux protein RcnA [Pantoea sp. alder81]